MQDLIDTGDSTMRVTESRHSIAILGDAGSKASIAHGIGRADGCSPVLISILSSQITPAVVDAVAYLAQEMPGFDSNGHSTNALDSMVDAIESSKARDIAKRRALYAVRFAACVVDFTWHWNTHSRGFDGEFSGCDNLDSGEQFDAARDVVAFILDTGYRPPHLRP